MAELQTKDFNYSLMECTDADREFLKGKEQSIKSRTTQTVIENGRDLLEAKARVGHGNFLKWVEGAFPWTRQTANNMMSVAESFKCKTVLHLENFQTRALYALASSTVPESARDEAIQKAESGEKVTHADAQELIRAHKLIADQEKRIAEYEDSIRKLKSQLPTKEVLQQISELQSQLLAEKNKPPQKVEVEKVVPPPDYESVRKEKLDLEIKHRELEEKIRKMKSSHEKELQEKSAQVLREAEKEIEVKQKQANVLNGKITQLKSEMQNLDKSAGALLAYKDLCSKLRKNMLDMSISMQDAFEEYPIPDEYIKDLKHIASEMKKGANMIDNFITGTSAIN